MTFRQRRKKSLKHKVSIYHAVTIHILVFCIALLLDDKIILCASDLSYSINKASVEADHFFERFPIIYDKGEDVFEDSVKNWHIAFSQLVKNSTKDFKTVINDHNYDGPCDSIHPLYFVLMDAFAFCCLILATGFFLYQDLNLAHVYGASRFNVFVAVHTIFDILIVLSVLNYPILELAKTCVNLSIKLETVVKELNELQRHLVGQGFNVNKYYLYTNIWSGHRFGVRDPIAGNVVDKSFYNWLNFYISLILFITFMLFAFLIYRSNKKSLVLWRRAIPSVLCVGVVFPSSSEPNR